MGGRLETRTTSTIIGAHCTGQGKYSSFFCNIMIESYQGWGGKKTSVINLIKIVNKS